MYCVYVFGQQLYWCSTASNKQFLSTFYEYIHTYRNTAWSKRSNFMCVSTATYFMNFDVGQSKSLSSFQVKMFHGKIIWNLLLLEML